MENHRLPGGNPYFVCNFNGKFERKVGFSIEMIGGGLINDNFLLQNVDFLLKNHDFLLKNVDWKMLIRGEVGIYAAIRTVSIRFSLWSASANSFMNLLRFDQNR